MAWSSYYSAVGGAGRLSRLLKETKQRLLLTDAVFTDLPDPEQISLSRSYASLSGNRDSLSKGISRNINDVWQLPLEPYNKMRLWLKFESGLSLKDWSYNGHKTWIKSSGKDQPIKRTVRDDGITEGSVYNIFDGQTQWVEVQDRQEIRLSDMLMDNNEINISCFISPFSQATFDEDGYTDLFYKVDSDEVAYAYRARMHADGTIKFTVIDNYAVHEVTTSSAGVIDSWDIGDFDPADFDSDEFETVGQAYQSDPDIEPPNWKILSFSYNVLTKQMQIWSAVQNPDDPLDITITQHPVTSTFTQDITNLSMHLPINEGNGTTLHDASGQGNDATLDTTPSTDSPTWDNGLLKFSGDTQRATIPNSAELNTFTSLQIGFKIKLTSYAQDANIDVIFSKNFSGSVGNGGFVFYMSASGSKTLNCVFKNNAGTSRTLTLVNAIPNLNQWYDVLASYDGTTFKLQVMGVGSATDVTAAGDTFTSSGDLLLGATTFSFQGYLANIEIYKGRVFDSDDISYFSEVIPGYRGGFPQWMPLPPDIPEDPVPTIRPLNKIYEVTEPVSSPGQVQLNNPASTTPFTSFYNVTGGTESTDPEVLKYNVPDGTESTSSVGFTSVYSLTGQSSTADLVWDSGDRGYGQVIRTSASNVFGKRLGRITLAGIKRASGASGTLQLGIIKANGTFIAFGSTFAVSSLDTGDWTTKTGDNPTNANPTGGYACAVGDGVGLKWTGGDGTIYVQRGGSNSYEDLSRSCQATFEDDDEWHITNSSYAVAGVFYEGGYTAGTPAFFKMGTTSYVVGDFQVNSTLEGIIPSKRVWRVRRVGSAASAILVCRIRNLFSSAVYTFPQTISFNSISTTTQDITFSDVNNTQAWADNYKITLEFSVKTGINDTTNYLEVNFNPGTGSGYVGGTSIRGQYYTGSGYDDLDPDADWAGQIYTGGKSFVPWVALNATRKRYGEKIVTNTPTPNAKGYARKVTKAEMTLRKVGDPVGPIKFEIYSDGVTTPKASGFTQVQADSLTTSGVVYPFTWVFNAYITALNDYLVVTFDNGTADNYVEIMINTDAAAGTSGDGQKMVAVEYVSGSGWAVKTDMDVAGIFYEGGIPDLTSHNRVSITVVTDASILKGEKITEATFKFKKIGAEVLTGNVEIWSRRGSDDTTRDLLGSFPATDISSTTVWTPKQVINRSAVHYLGVSDKISIEYSGGDQSNGILVMLRNEDVFDGNETMYSEYDSIQWGSPIDNKEIVGEMWTGGDTYTPDPGTPYVAPPLAYNPNLFILAGNGGGSGSGDNGITPPQTMTGMRIRDFRLLAGAVYGEVELTNLIKNKHTILDILTGQTALGGYTTLTND